MSFTIKCNKCNNEVIINTYKDKRKLADDELSIYVCTDVDWDDEIRCKKCGNKIEQELSDDEE